MIIEQMVNRSNFCINFTYPITARLCSKNGYLRFVSYKLKLAHIGNFCCAATIFRVVFKCSVFERESQ